jgi:RNA polymerase-binding transcription factor DksA
MTTGQLSKFRDQLRALAARIDRTVAELEDQVRVPTSGQSAGGLSNAPLHMGDVGTDVYSQELGTTLLENETYIRNEILAALARIDQGTYGQCENCQKSIPIERIDAIPYTRYCAPCAERLQAGRAVNFNEGRPENWLGAPGHETLNPAAIPDTVLTSKATDVHAVGTPGGGTAVGGLAGTTIGEGNPTDANLEEAMGSSEFDVKAETGEGSVEETEAYSGPAGGAVGGMPANKRSRGGLVTGNAPPGNTTSPRKPTKKAANPAKKNPRTPRRPK